MLNANDLINFIRLNPKSTDYVISQLWIEFFNSMTNSEGHIIIGCPHTFIESVNKVLKIMDAIVSAFPDERSNLIWVPVANLKK